MQFSIVSLFTTLFVFFVSIQASPVALVARKALDVFVPRIITPDSNTFWTIGDQATVAWDTSDAPQNISNGAYVVLHDYGVVAKDFSLRDGNVTFTVPAVKPGPFFITLFGDSGNYSPVFTIEAPGAKYSTQSAADETDMTDASDDA